MLSPRSADSELAIRLERPHPLLLENSARASSLTSAAPLGQGQPPELWMGGVGGATRVTLGGKCWSWAESW